MNPAMKRTPQWWSDLPITKRLRKQIRSILTLTRDGYVIWYRGKPRNVCGKKTPPADVLNGIAYDPAGKRIFVTGKKWPRVYEIRTK